MRPDRCENIPLLITSIGDSQTQFFQTESTDFILFFWVCSCKRVIHFVAAWFGLKLCLQRQWVKCTSVATVSDKVGWLVVWNFYFAWTLRVGRSNKFKGFTCRLRPRASLILRTVCPLTFSSCFRTLFFMYYGTYCNRPELICSLAVKCFHPYCLYCLITWCWIKLNHQSTLVVL